MNPNPKKKVAVIAPLALEAVRRMDELFAIEREINGHPAAERLAVRIQRSAPIVAALEEWMRAERPRLPGAAPVAKAMNYMLDRWPSFARFLDDGVPLRRGTRDLRLRFFARRDRGQSAGGLVRGCPDQAAASRLAGVAGIGFQFHGSSSARRWAGWDAMRPSTSASQA